MAGSVFGTHFRISTWGESHGPAIGVVVDGCPAGLELSEADIQVFLDRRRPGQSRYTTSRKESDTVEILSGVFEGRTTGTPISMIVRNEDHHSADYSNIADTYRPGHADYTFDMKYGFRDYRGGGRSSARETIGRTAAGAIASGILKELGISLLTWVDSIGDICIDPARFDAEEIPRNPLNMPDSEAAAAAADLLEDCIRRQDSVGGVIACRIDGVPAGIGEPVFDKLDAALAHAIFSIGAVKGFEIGDGFAAAKSFGSCNNDPFIPDQHGGITKAANHAGGILGGISDGTPIFFKAAFKPTPSIAMPQQTVKRSGEPAELVIRGRHDPVIVPRAVVVVESMAAITLLDLLMADCTSTTAHLRAVREM